MTKNIKRFFCGKNCRNFTQFFENACKYAIVCISFRYPFDGKINNMEKMDLFSTCAPAQVTERLDLSCSTDTRCDLYKYVWTLIYDTKNFRQTSESPATDDEDDGILSAFRELYDSEPVHTLKVKKDCLRRAYWEVYRSDYVTYSKLELTLMQRALELMNSSRFKKMMRAVGADIDEDETAWLEGWGLASHFVLYGSETVKRFVRGCKDTPFQMDDAIDDPFFETTRIKEVIDNSDPYYMEGLLSYPDSGEQEKERKLNKRWFESRLI